MIMPAYPTTLETIPDLTSPQCCKILSQIASTLEYLHRKRVRLHGLKANDRLF